MTRSVRAMRARLVQLYAGLLLYGVSSSLLVLAGLGLDPWDVFHQGLSRTIGLAIGTWAIIVGAARPAPLDPAAAAAGDRDDQQRRARRRGR